MDNNRMTYEQFSKIYATTRALVKATSILHDMVDEVMDTPDDIYIDIIVLHNKACDFIEAYQKKFKKED